MSERDADELFGEEHVERYRKTDGEVGHDWRGASVLLLTTRGRRSGEERTTPLIYGSHQGDYLIVASKAGAPQPPAWYLNLREHPEVGVQVRGGRFTAYARTAKARREAPDVAADDRHLARVRLLPEEDRPGDPGRGARAARDECVKAL